MGLFRPKESNIGVRSQIFGQKFVTQSHIFQAHSAKFAAPNSDGANAPALRAGIAHDHGIIVPDFTEDFHFLPPTER
jgi:hypothetical protein